MKTVGIVMKERNDGQVSVYAVYETAEVANRVADEMSERAKMDGTCCCYWAIEEYVEPSGIRRGIR